MLPCVAGMFGCESGPGLQAGAVWVFVKQRGAACNLRDWCGRCRAATWSPLAQLGGGDDDPGNNGDRGRC